MLRKVISSCSSFGVRCVRKRNRFRGLGDRRGEARGGKLGVVAAPTPPHAPPWLLVASNETPAGRWAKLPRGFTTRMTDIYHITQHDNLVRIIEHGLLLCDRRRVELGLEPVNIAYAHLKERRAETPVPLPPGGTLDRYVPFYFAPRSPMLYVNWKQKNRSSNGQVCIVHLRSSCEAVAGANLRFTFTDGHATMQPLTSFYGKIGDLGKIDWSVMKSKMWTDTPSQPDRRRRRQAEFLVHQSFPWTLVQEIGVINENVKQVVETIVSSAAHRPSVVVRRDWYYE